MATKIERFVPSNHTVEETFETLVPGCLYLWTGNSSTGNSSTGKIVDVINTTVYLRTEDSLIAFFNNKRPVDVTRTVKTSKDTFILASSDIKVVLNN